MSLWFMFSKQDFAKELLKGKREMKYKHPYLLNVFVLVSQQASILRWRIGGDDAACRPPGTKCCYKLSL